MIVRILTEGQFTVDESEMDGLNKLDDELQAAVESGDDGRFGAALSALLDRVRSAGTPVPNEELLPSDLVLPSSDATLHEVSDLLGEEGLIPD